MRYINILLLLMSFGFSMSLLVAQDENNTLPEITSSLGEIQKVELSPNGKYVAVMTINPMGDTAIEVWDLSKPSNPLRVVPDLTMFENFFWSPNSQYLATRGRRGNASGTEFAIIVYDVGDPFTSDSLFPRTSQIFKEFVYCDGEQLPIYRPLWSVDSRVIAINRLDGIHFYDITDCPDHKCRLLHILDVGYVDWFDWRGDRLITLEYGTIKFWDIADIFE